MHLPQSNLNIQNESQSPCPIPRILFTVVDPKRETQSIKVIQRLQLLSEEAARTRGKPLDQTYRVISTDEVEGFKAHFPEAVALFDGNIQGFYAPRHSRAFSGQRDLPEWIFGSKWAVCISENLSKRQRDCVNNVARQLLVMYGTKFAQFAQRGVFRTAPPPKVERKPRARRSASRYTFM